MTLDLTDDEAAALVMAISGEADASSSAPDPADSRPSLPPARISRLFK
jgi:hypothetical protein